MTAADCSQRHTDDASHGLAGRWQIATVLAQAGIARAEAASLLRSVTGLDQAYLIAHADQQLGEAAVKRFFDLARRRRLGEPVAYLTGRREFYGLELEVDPAVLIPRPETELLVDLALERLPPGRSGRVLDLGTGSGAIALALAQQRPELEIIAVDRSPAALAVARRNLRRLLPERADVLLVQGDWCDGLAARRFDLIVSNPPYIAAGDPHLSAGDLRFEPAQALLAGEDGLESIRRIVRQAPDILQTGGTLLFEHGYDQAGACRRLLEQAGFAQLFAASDLAGIGRVAGGQRP